MSNCQIEQQSAIPNSEWIYVASADCVSSTELNFNEKSGVSASENFEVGIAERQLIALQLNAKIS
jgi:hypothetical protein